MYKSNCKLAAILKNVLPNVDYQLGWYNGNLCQISCLYHQLWINHEQMYIYAIYRQPY